MCERWQCPGGCWAQPEWSGEHRPGTAVEPWLGLQGSKGHTMSMQRAWDSVSLRPCFWAVSTLYLSHRDTRPGTHLGLLCGHCERTAAESPQPLSSTLQGCKNLTPSVFLFSKKFVTLFVFFYSLVLVIKPKACVLSCFPALLSLFILGTRSCSITVLPRLL